MKTLSALSLMLLALVSFAQKPSFQGEYINSYRENSGYEQIEIEETSECFSLKWSHYDENGNHTSIKKEKTKCRSYETGEYYVFVILWGEEYELWAFEHDSEGLISKFEVIGFDEETIFSRVYE